LAFLDTEAFLLFILILPATVFLFYIDPFTLLAAPDAFFLSVFFETPAFNFEVLVLLAFLVF